MSVSEKEGFSIIAILLNLKKSPLPYVFFFLLDKKRKKNQDGEPFSRLTQKLSRLLFKTNKKRIFYFLEKVNVPLSFS